MLSFVASTGLTPDGLSNERLQERIRGLKEDRQFKRTEPVKASKKFRRQSPFNAILSGDLEEVSLSDIRSFIDEARATTLRIEKDPSVGHDMNCICFDHLDFSLKRQLARLTVGDEEYGETVFYRPTFWSPPAMKLAMTGDTQEIMVFAFISFGLVAVIILCLLAYIVYRFRQARLKKAADKELQLEVEPEAAEPEGVDISRVDIFT